MKSIIEFSAEPAGSVCQAGGDFDVSVDFAQPGEVKVFVVEVEVGYDRDYQLQKLVESFLIAREIHFGMSGGVEHTLRSFDQMLGDDRAQDAHVAWQDAQSY